VEQKACITRYRASREELTLHYLSRDFEAGELKAFSCNIFPSLFNTACCLLSRTVLLYSISIAADTELFVTMVARRFRNSSLKTPPESFTSPLLTPPPSEQKSKALLLAPIIEEITNRRKGHNFSSQPWQRFELDENEFKALLQVLQKDGFTKDKLRYDSNNKGLIRFANIETQIRLFPVNQTVRTPDAHCITRRFRSQCR
jgi:hypothetical protein